MAESAQTKLREAYAKLVEENARLEADCKKLVRQIAQLEREIERFRKMKGYQSARKSLSLTAE